jgi:hypothetical protein
VVGAIDGGAGNDDFQFSYVGYDPALAGILANSYTTANFETTSTNITILVAPQATASGATRLYDDGVVLAFTSKDGNGIDVCSGPMGFKVGTVDFAALEAGQAIFDAGNAGWFLNAVPLGNRQFQVEVYDTNGILQSDDFTFNH